MNRVVLRDGSNVGGRNHWGLSAGDLALEACTPLLERYPVDAVFAASPLSQAGDRQMNFCACIADRLVLDADAHVFGIEAGEASGAAALHAAYAHVAAGLSRHALVVGVAKISDRTEAEMSSLLDGILDQDAEPYLGISYAAQAGLLADAYLTRHRLKPMDLAKVVARNQANAAGAGDSIIKAPASPAEIRQDVKVASPLVRSDFAPLLDGACALIVSAQGELPGAGPSALDILSIASARDASVLWDREDPLEFKAARRACERALASGRTAFPEVGHIEVGNPCSIVEILTLEAIGATGPGATAALSEKGFGGRSSRPVVNASGGAFGNGNRLGISGIDQAWEALRMVRGEGGGTEMAGPKGADARTLCLATTCFGSVAYATVLGRTPP